MEEGQDSTGATPAVAAASAGPDDGPISKFRIARLAVLLAVLIAVGALALGQRVRSSREEAARRREAALLVAEARGRLAALNLIGASDSLEAAYELDPANPGIARLLVPLLYAGGDLEGALDQFHSLGLGESARIDGMLKEYVRSTGAAWALANRVTAGGENDTERALLLCRWFAHYLLPPAADALPAEPVTVVRRGHGSPVQLAWTYAELARQAGLSCWVVVFPESSEAPRIVRVSPADAEPLLVDPSRGIRVRDPQLEEAVRQAALSGPPSAVAVIPEETQMHGAATMATETPSGPLLAVAAHPASLDARLLALEELLADLPDHPELYLRDPAGAGPGPLQAWRAPAQILIDRSDPRNAARVVEESQRMSLVSRARNEAMVGNHVRARAAYDACAEALERALQEADVAETAGMIAGSLEDVRFYAAASAHEAGDVEDAATRLGRYADEYPGGKWTLLVEVLLADVASRRGDVDEACRLWSALPEPRKAYGACRIDELGRAAAVPPSDAAPSPAAPL